MCVCMCVRAKLSMNCKLSVGVSFACYVLVGKKFNFIHDIFYPVLHIY